MSIRLAENYIQMPKALGAVVEQTDETTNAFELEAESVLPETDHPPLTPSFTHIAKIVSELVPLAVEMHSTAEEPIETAEPPAAEIPVESVGSPESTIPIATVGISTDSPAEIPFDFFIAEATIATPLPPRKGPDIEPIGFSSGAPKLEGNAVPIASGNTLQTGLTEPKPAGRRQDPLHPLPDHPSELGELPKPRPEFSAAVPEPAVQMAEKPVLAQNQAGIPVFPEAGVVGEVEKPRFQPAFTAPTALQPAPPQQPPQQVASQIVAAVSKGSDDTIELRLDPPELGRVHVSISTTDAGLSAVITTEKTDIVELLRRNSDLLAREFAKAGFEGATLKFAHQEQSPQNPKPGQSVGFAGVPDEEAAGLAVVQSPSVQLGGLDIRL